MNPLRRFKFTLTLLLACITFYGITMIDFSKAVSPEKKVPSFTQPFETPQPNEGICNRGEGAYPCLLTEDPATCPDDAQAILYRAATCAPCDADTTDCPCAPDLYECQSVGGDCA